MWDRVEDGSWDDRLEVGEVRALEGGGGEASVPK